MSKTVRTLLATVMLFFSSLSFADNINDMVTLKGYVDKHCKKNCVDVGVLLQALYNVNRDLGVEPASMLAIVRQESAFVVKATNRGNVGLAQILLRYHRSKFRTKNYFDPSDNIRVGAIVFGECVKKHPKDKRQSFRCYNGYQFGDQDYYSKISKHLREINSLNFRTL